MIPGQPTESLFPRGLGKVALHPRRPTTAIIPAALPSAAPPRLENQSRYEKVGLAERSDLETAYVSATSGPPASTKRAKLIGMLERAEGASVAEIGQRLGWLPHTVRAAITGLRKAG